MTTRKHYFLASCAACADAEVPFLDRAERDDWAARHRARTGHEVATSEQWREPGIQHDLGPAPSVPTQPAESLEPAGPGPTLLCVGGPAHGRQVSVGVNDEQWLDLASAQAYRRQWFLAGTDNPLTGRPTRMWRRPALVWEGIGSPSDAVMQLANWLYGKWCEQGGDQVDTAELSPPIKPSNGGKPQ